MGTDGYLFPYGVPSGSWLGEPIMSTEPLTGEIFDVRGLAKRWGRSPFTVYRMHERGEGPTPVRIGGGLRWRREDVETWEIQRRAKPARRAGGYNDPGQPR